MGLNLNLGNINKAAKDFTHRRTEVPEETIRDVGIEVIKADPQQPRKEFDDDALKELAESIKTHGLIQPIVLRRTKKASFISLPEKDVSGLSN